MRLAPTVEREAAVIAEIAAPRAPAPRHAVGRRWRCSSGPGMTEIPVLQRALVAAGVPVEVAADELPLRDHPALAPLLTRARGRPRRGCPDPRRRPAAAALPARRREPLRAAPARSGAARPARARTQDSDPPPSQVLIRDALLEPGAARRASAAGAPARELARLPPGRGPAAAPQRAARPTSCSGRCGQGARWADRSASATLTVRARRRRRRTARSTRWSRSSTSRRAATSATRGVTSPSSSPRSTAQEIPAASDVRRRRPGSRGPADDGAPQQGPGVGRRRGLRACRRTSGPTSGAAGRCCRPTCSARRANASPPPSAELRREERRLFYVAITRARRRLVCTAVEAPSDDGLRPSPFLDDLDVESPATIAGTGRPLTLAGVTAELRSVVARRPAEAAAPRRGRHEARHAGRRSSGPTAGGSPRQRTPDGGGGSPTSPTRTIRAGIRPRPVAVRFPGGELLRLPAAVVPAPGGSRRRPAEAPPPGSGSVHALADAVARGELPADIDALTRRARRRVGAAAVPGGVGVGPGAPRRSRGARRGSCSGTRGPRPSVRRHRAAVRRHVHGRRVRRCELRGRLDRLERDDRGQSRRRRSQDDGEARRRRKRSQANLQLATYRRARRTRRRARRHRGGRRARPAAGPGATCVTPGPKVQRQETTTEAAVR